MATAETVNVLEERWGPESRNSTHDAVRYRKRARRRKEPAAIPSFPSVAYRLLLIKKQHRSITQPSRATQSRHPMPTFHKSCLHHHRHAHIPTLLPLLRARHTLLHQPNRTSFCLALQSINFFLQPIASVVSINLLVFFASMALAMSAFRGVALVSASPVAVRSQQSRAGGVRAEAETTTTNKAARINPSIRKDSDKVVDTVVAGELAKPMTAYCRCWRSETFPLCNGAHAKHNKETGDNVGPLLLKK